jgi:DNA gyrase/topoisomerase IV subunit B
MEQKRVSTVRSLKRGRLRIGNDWNAITIIALSQSNPLKAVAELVENSIDARATSVSITRGRSEGNHYLEIRDDGQGIPRDAEGLPDFRYVATHICDSVKRRLKEEGVSGLQGSLASVCFPSGRSEKNCCLRQPAPTIVPGK